MPKTQLSLFEMLLLKEEYDNESLLIFQTKELQFIFKPLTPIDFIKAKTLVATDEELNDTICQLCVVKPSDFDFSISPFGGISEFAAKEIIKFSKLDSFKKPLQALESYREEIESDFLTKCILFVKANFQEYTYEEIKEWPYEKIMKHTALAEYISTIRGINFKLEFDLEEIEKIKPKRLSPNELIKHGIDPILYNEDLYKKEQSVIDKPFIIGIDWDEDEIIEKNLENIYKARKYNKEVLSVE